MVEDAMTFSVAGAPFDQIVDSDALLAQLQYQHASLDSGMSIGKDATTGSVRSGSARLPLTRPVSSGLVHQEGPTVPLAQQQTLANLLRVRALVSATRARLEQQRTHEFLHACSSGNLERIRVVRRWQQHCYM